MNEKRLQAYKQEFLHRLPTRLKEEEFLKTFFERWEEDLETDLKSADSADPESYESALESWVTTASHDYDSWWAARDGRVQRNVKPKKRQRPYKASNAAGPWERQETLARYLARAASEDRRIVGFRTEVLSGRLLSEEEALIFLSSPLAASSWRSTLKMLRLNILDTLLDTKYRLEEEQDDHGLYKKLIRERGSHTLRPLLRTPSRLIFPGDLVTSDDLRISRGGSAVVVVHPREKDRFVVARTKSIMADIVSLAEDTLKGYPISREMGVWFILTGEFIPEDPIRIHYTTTRRPEELHRTTITLEVESWLSPEEVLEQYRHAQHKILGRTPRSLKRDTLAVFSFVNQRRGKSWSKRVEAWNEEHPRKRFKDRRHLYQAYMRAVEILTGVEPPKARKRSVLGTLADGTVIFSDKWYLLHARGGFTGTFDSREEAQADHRSADSEVLTSQEILTRLIARNKTV